MATTVMRLVHPTVMMTRNVTAELEPANLYLQTACTTTVDLAMIGDQMINVSKVTFIAQSLSMP